MEKVVARVNERTPTGHIYSPKCFEPYKGKHLPVFKPGAEGYPDRNAFPLGLATITRIEGNEVFADFNLTVEGQELLKLYRPGAAADFILAIPRTADSPSGVHLTLVKSRDPKFLSGTQLHPTDLRWFIHNQLYGDSTHSSETRS